jgi:2-hydroxychromene-2-carboxylate isomerase
MEWAQAKQHFGSDDWRSMVEQHQIEMVEGMGLWGVPCYRLQGPSSEPDLEVWGQDRLWLVAKEIRRRTNLLKAR